MHRGIGPGEPGWVELKAIETRLKQRLRKSPPDPVLETLATRRLAEMSRAIALGDWEGCTGECQKLVRLIAAMTPPKQR